jgi:hypothetical protein
VASLQTILTLLKAIITVVVIFDPATVAGCDKPQQYSKEILDVFVNGVAVLKNREHTNVKPVKFIKSPGVQKIEISVAKIVHVAVVFKSENLPNKKSQ